MILARTIDAAVLALEGAAAAAAGLGFTVAALAGDPHDRGTAVVLGVLLTLFGAALLFLARGIARDRQWARTPSYLVQFFGLIVAWYQRSTLPAVSVLLAVVCVGAVVALSSALRSRE